MQISEALSYIRQRPGIYLGAVVDGNKPNGGIYTMLREVLNNSINEPEYPPVHIKGEDFEVAFTHTRRFYRRQAGNRVTLR